MLLCAAVLSWAGEVSAEPYLAVREGYKCSACHVNKTGGGMRTSFVAVHAQDILHYPDWFSELTSPADQFSGEINKYVSIGADLRVDATATFQDTPKNGEVRNNQVFRGRLDEFEIDVQEAVGYLEVKLIPDLLTAYVDLRFAPNTDAREAWALMYLPWDVWIKGGKMFLPYGLQLQDDTAFIRGGRNGSATTGFSFNQQQAAFQIGWEPGPWFAAFAVSNGPSGNRDVQLTGTVYGMFTDLPVVGNLVRNFLIGGSATRVSPSGSDTVVAGAFTGFNLGLFTYLGEVDFRWDKNMASTNGSTRSKPLSRATGLSGITLTS